MHILGKRYKFHGAQLTEQFLAKESNRTTSQLLPKMSYAANHPIALRYSLKDRGGTGIATLLRNPGNNEHYPSHPKCVTGNVTRENDDHQPKTHTATCRITNRNPNRHKEKYRVHRKNVVGRSKGVPTIHPGKSTDRKNM